MQVMAFSNGEVDLVQVAERASALFVERAKEAGRRNLLPGDSVYGPGDVLNTFKAAEEVAGNGRVRDAIFARLQEMMDDVQAKQAACRDLLEAGDTSDAAFTDKAEAQAVLDGAREIARLVLGEEVKDAAV